MSTTEQTLAPASPTSPGDDGARRGATDLASDTAPERTAPSWGRRRTQLRWSVWGPVLTGLLALVPRALTAGSHQVTDEVLWIERSLRFSEAIRTGDLAAASSTTEALATMPGVTTMWLGTLGRVLWGAGHRLGLIDNADPFQVSMEALHLSQLMVVLATSALIAGIVALVWRWAGATPALTTGALLATEPFLVAHGAVLHTDELTALFGAAGAIALLMALDWPRLVTERPRRMAGLAGVLLAGSVLTKLSAAALAPGLAVVVAVVVVGRAVAARRSGHPVRPVLTSAGAVLAVVGLAGVLTTVVLWPAIWADTAEQVELVRLSASMAGTGHVTYFQGHATTTPGPTFYAVTTPMRMTPWFLVAAVVLAPLALARRWWGHSIPLVVVAAPAVYVLSTAAKQFDRYVVLVLPYLAIAVGLGLVVAADAVVRRRRHRRRVLVPAGVAAMVAAGLHASVVAPWGLAYFNPLLGGADRAEETMLVGWGEGLELAGERIAELEGSDCDVTIALGYHRTRTAFPCGRLIDHLEWEQADYLVFYINQRQRLSSGDVDEVRSRGRLVGEVRIHGLLYAEVYDLRS